MILKSVETSDIHTYAKRKCYFFKHTHLNDFNINNCKQRNEIKEFSKILIDTIQGNNFR